MRKKILNFLIIAVTFNGVLIANTLTEETKSIVGHEVDPNNQRSEIKPKVADNSALHDKLDEIFNILTNQYPEFYKNLTVDNEEQMIQAILTIVNPRVKYVFNSVGKKDQIVTEQEKESICRGVMIAKNRILYLRINEFSPEQFTQLEGDCISTSNLAFPPIGIIIDLRSCHGFDIHDALKSLQLFCDPKRLPKNKLQKKVKRFYDEPMAILVGKNTVGAAEIFAELTKKAKQGLVLGETTAGNPFSGKRIPLTSGGTLIVPLIPEYLKSLVISRIKPAIEIRAYPQIEFKNITEKAGAEKVDKCISRTADLLVSLDALKNGPVNK